MGIAHMKGKDKMLGYLIFHRVTVLGDGCFTVSTIGPSPHLPETMIFDERRLYGRSRYCEYHSNSDDLNERHEDVVRRFAAGEIVLDDDEEEVEDEAYWEKQYEDQEYVDQEVQE